MNTFFAMSTLILSTGQVLLGLAAVAGAIYLGIFATKTYLRQQSQKMREEGGPTSATLRKYEAVDVRQHAANIKLAGLTSALAVVLIIFAWTQFTSERVIAEFYPELETIEMDIPPTSQPKPKLPPALPPPPAKSKIDIEVVDNIIEPEPVEDPEPIDNVSPTPPGYTGPVDPHAIELPPVIEPTPVEPEPEEDIIINIAEQMPRFPGCEEMAGDNNAKKACADQNLLKYIYANIQYPAMARENGIEGMAVVSFVVDKNGKLTDLNILRDPGGGCGREALRVIKNMNKMSDRWTPGKQRGKAVRVRYNLPVRFKLNT